MLAVLEESHLQGRATKDIDMIMVCEALTEEYLTSYLLINPATYLLLMMQIYNTGVSELATRRTIYNSLRAIAAQASASQSALW